MDIALSTLVLFTFLLPGIIFRRFYYSEEFSKEYFKQTLLGIFISSLIPSIAIQCLWALVIKIFNYEIDYILIGQLIGGSTKDAAFKNIQDFFTPIVLYNLSILTFSGVCGHYSKQIVRINKWDRRYKLLRFQNSWHYILKGEFFDFPRAASDLSNDKVEDIEVIFVDALVKMDGQEAVIYDGLLVDYELSKNGGLEHISLKEVRRRPLVDGDRKKKEDHTKKEKANSRFYEISGHILILKYSDIINLNFSYFKLKQDESGKFYSQAVS